MIIGTDDVPHGANIWVVEQGYYRGLTSGSDLFGVVCSLSITVVVMLVGGLSGYNFYSALVGIASLASEVEVDLKGLDAELTCSPVSKFLANLTLPMLPAPIVFPNDHFPVCASISVRFLVVVEPLA